MSKKGVFKQQNSYQEMLSLEFYEKCPKAVFAAIAVSFVLNHQGTDSELTEETILKEWGILHQSGIIPQKPYRELKNAEDIYG